MKRQTVSSECIQLIVHVCFVHVYATTYLERLAVTASNEPGPPLKQFENNRNESIGNATAAVPSESVIRSHCPQAS